MIEWLTTTEVGARLGRGRDYVLRLCEEGRLDGAYRTTGGHWRIPAAAVGSFLEANRARVIRRRTSHSAGASHTSEKSTT